MKFSFKNRIAFHYMIATAITMGMVFIVVFFIVKTTVYANLDNDLYYEANKHTYEIKIHGDSIQFINKAEWEEREHQEIQVNPVFIQLIDKKFRLMAKSPNLKNNQLMVYQTNQIGKYVDVFLDGRAIRQIQVKIERNGEIKGYILVAMSSESAKLILLNLKNVLILSYFFSLLGLYFISRYLAGKSIIPVKNIMLTTNRITKNNLRERVELPVHRDELYHLSSSINELLQRIENAIERERQFTSDASHQLRTPLASLRGNLEVLIRKPRTIEEYVNKIKYSLTEINQMSNIIEQLLLLARLNSNSISNNTTINLLVLLENILEHYRFSLIQKEIKIVYEINCIENCEVIHYYSNLILDNLIGNAIKYSPPKTSITLTIDRLGDKTCFKIKDEGIGIMSEDLEKIFTPFFRSDALNHKQIEGNGLGLSIVKKSVDAIGANIQVASQLGVGTIFTIIF